MLRVNELVRPVLHFFPKLVESSAVESRLNDMRILGMPVQFVVVVAVSLALTIYFGAWAADARMDARVAQAAGQEVQQFDFRSSVSSSGGSGLAGGLGAGADISGSGSQSGEAAEGQAWEKLFLFACPLH